RLDEEPSGDGPILSRLRYHRPLREGESVTYEFSYEPDRVMVYPALGRLAFLLEASGVRLHWLTDGADAEWTGLAPDNAVADAASVRGPATLPLRTGWNTAQLRLAGGKVVVDLNGTTVFERPLEPSNDRQFSLFHYKDRTAVEVRNVVLR